MEKLIHLLMLTYVLASNKLIEKKPTKLLAHVEDIEDIKSIILSIGWTTEEEKLETTTSLFDGIICSIQCCILFCKK
ncbi:hypothetical protein BAAL111456_10440 [Bacillus albus]